MHNSQKMGLTLKVYDYEHFFCHILIFDGYVVIAMPTITIYNIDFWWSMGTEAPDSVICYVHSTQQNHVQFDKFEFQILQH